MSEKTSTIGLLFANPTDRELVMRFLGDLGYQVWAPQLAEKLPAEWPDVDLVLADEAAARRYSEVADVLAVAIHQAQLHLQVQRHAEELEQRVAERTAELRQKVEFGRQLLPGEAGAV